MREKVQLHCFFILYDNMNFYKHMYNARIFNCGTQINYTSGYICFIDFLRSLEASEDDSSDLDSWHKQYLLASLIDCIAINTLSAKEFIFSDVDCLHRAPTIRHTISEVLSRYFAKAMENQKIELDDIQPKNPYPFINSH